MKRTLPALLGVAVLAAPFVAAAAGPDLTGLISAPASGEAGLEVRITFEIQNIGSAPAPATTFRIMVDPDPMADGSEPTRHDLVLYGDVPALAPSEVFSDEIGAALPSPLRGDRYTFELEIDPAKQTGDVDRSNNLVRSATKMTNRKPNLEIRPGWAVDLVDGCFYGEPLEAVIRSCNNGRAGAVGFYPGVVMGELDQLTLIEDVPAATFPQSCHGAEHPNYAPCAEVEGETPSCVAGTCRIECESDEGCGSNLYCREDPLLAEALGKESAKSCMNWLDFPAIVGSLPVCQTFTMKGTIPVANQQGNYYEDQQQRFHLISDVEFSLSESRPHQISTQAFDCRVALPDLVPTSLAPKSRIVAGEATPIARQFKNLGFIEHPRVLPPVPTPETVTFEYQYYLSTAPDISVNQIPLVVLSTGDMGSAEIGRKGEIAGTDLVMVPPNTAPGIYYIGLIADPDGKVPELSKANNVLVHSEQIRVEPPSLRILTDNLPAATIGARFTYQLVAQGGIGPYIWSASELPPGVGFGEDGILGGATTEVGDFPFTVRVTSGEHRAERMLVLRSLPPLGSLQITTSLLPPAVRNIPYGGWTDEFGARHEGLPLAASGGVRPYKWRLDPTVAENWMPQGLEFVSPGGIVRGTPSTQSTTREVVVEVEDQIGNTVTKAIRVVVVSSADLVIKSQLFAEGTTAQPYDSCIEAAGGDSSAPYEWSLERSTIPAGLQAEQRGNQACLVGTPTVCSNFLVKATVSDAGGQSYSASIPLSVECDVIQLTTRSLPTVKRGEEVEQQLSSSGGPGTTYRLYQGRLPAGLSLSSDGLISGTVDEDAEFGGYSFIIQIKDEAGKQGLSALSITVEVEPREPTTKKKTESNCSAASGVGAGAPVGLALALLGLVRRRIKKD